MQSSPGSPGATRSSDSSRTYSSYPGIARPIVTGWPGRHSAYVAVTVDSVGPYVFSTRRPGRHQRWAVASGHLSPPKTSNRTEGMSSVNIDTNVGTVDRNVTPAAERCFGKSGPARLISGVAGTSAAPFAHAIHLSSRDASKATENPW